MSTLESQAAWAASAALIGLAVIPLSTFWGFNLCGKRSGQPSQRVKFARISLQMALPVFTLAVLLAVVSPAIIATLPTSTGRLRSSDSRVATAAVYTALTSSFTITAAGILTTVAVYLSGICVLYLVLAKQKWWKIVRLDALCGAALLLVLDIAWFAKTVSDSLNGNDDGISLAWLIVLVDITVCLLAAVVVGVAIYVAPKLKRRTDLAVGNLSSLLLSASFLWLFRCAFVLSVDLKSIIPDWTAIELSAQKILYPILDFWVSATVLGLVTFILRNPVLCDPSAIPDHPPEQQPQVYVQYVPVGFYSQPRHGQQPQMYQQYHQYYPPQPRLYQQPP
ncbi:hypothetical protein C8A01DRAFT_15517 [Parachaetomium inaequale]|uniref:Uncharacterized protein n=1 Tax=Parachaetomium inaequale TaxID=2588326 RepID=A0AAN6PKC1_9PEZI|nr:hypothetical protein C8A01DRAFT_15517 [Parachaetomium inaequale]